ncbi:MAG: ferrous iron transport protein A [Chitinophagaceae bacterium]|jgi:ferrous iron transport protein A|nr:ferrous iron transport protein A [Chitinophagaceae bacterium]MBK7678110.1 ferrous iron transport protein A [Chitinophagaceae bacterium]MBK8301426.1 ferrous iron transport protein A [Chitinophagaceae bacterium]MBK9466056.1 ferrous iron transport protein A [Chitinophagaceae bacterium]MBK9661371.1 ferrous iron transport protein A [Chitinophagaceae bacterium]
MIVRLSELKPGQEGIIKEFNSNEIFLKLMEMGCVPGEKILLEQIAPLGDPISVNVSGYHLSLRLNEAEHILVELNH